MASWTPLKVAGSIDKVSEAIAARTDIPPAVKDYIAASVKALELNGTDELDAAGEHGVIVEAHGHLSDSKVNVHIEIERIVVGAPRISQEELTRRREAKALQESAKKPKASEKAPKPTA